MPVPEKILPYLKKKKRKKKYSRPVLISILLTVLILLVIFVNWAYYWVVVDQKPVRLTIPLGHPVITGKEHLRIELTKAGLEYIPKEKKLSVYIENFGLE